MFLYTDSPELADRVLPSESRSWRRAASEPPAEIDSLIERLFGARVPYAVEVETDFPWRFLFVIRSAPRSHYDLLVELSRGDECSGDGILCLAGTGLGFHGHRERPWSATAGNIHLSVLLAPRRCVDRFSVAFTILAAVSVIDAIDAIPELRQKAAIKWVNDVLVEDAKVCGVLAHTQTQGNEVKAAVLGIGLNVETTPEVKPTPFVPEVASLWDFLPNQHCCGLDLVFGNLAAALYDNYRRLLEEGCGPLLNRYRQRSLVLGREVTIFSDRPAKRNEIIADGRVVALGENLELLIEGAKRPITRGRLVLKNR